MDLFVTFLTSLWQRWQLRGACSRPQPTWDESGWVLTLCFRAKLSAWLLFLLFTGLLVSLLVFHEIDPLPRREFLLCAVVFSACSLLGSYYLIFVYAYRVLLDEGGVELSRFLLPTQRIEWEDLIAFDYRAGDELLKLRSRNGKKISLYLALHGLSYLRRGLATLTKPGALIASWLTADPALMSNVPSWRCGEVELSQSPFEELSPWSQRAKFCR